MSNHSTSNSLWQFMLGTYAQAGVKELCLRAQNEYGIDVLLLLMDAWLKKEKLAWPNQSELQQYLSWRQQMIIPLRALRMSLVKDEEPLRSQLLTAELSAEKKGVAFLTSAHANSAEVNAEHFLEKNFVFFNNDLNDTSKDIKQFELPASQLFYTLFTEQLILNTNKSV